MNKTLTGAVMATVAVAVGSVGYRLDTYMEAQTAVQVVTQAEQKVREATSRYDTWRAKLLGTLYPQMWNGDALGNAWVDESRAPASILEGDALGNVWVSEAKVLKDLKQIYELGLRCP